MKAGGGEEIEGTTQWRAMVGKSIGLGGDNLVGWLLYGRGMVLRR